MSKSNFEARVVETRYGKRLLIRVGGERMWLGEKEVRELFSAIIDSYHLNLKGSWT